MRISILLALIFMAFWMPASAWEMRGNVYPVDDGIIEWTPQNFAGFYLDESLGTESLSFNISGEQLHPGTAVYQTQVTEVPFRHSDWGNYLVMCFLGQKYFVGYPEGCRISDPWMLLSLDYYGLGPVLIDTDEGYTVAGNEALLLKGGYSLKLSDAEEGVKASLYRRDNLIDSQVLQPPATYIYKGPIGNDTATLIAVGLKANVRLEPTSYYTIKGIFQVSEDVKPLDVGMNFGEMEIDAISSTDLLLDNENTISLSKGRDFELMDGFRIKTSDANASSNQVYIYKNASESSIPEIRGEVATGTFTWTADRFAGFYCDLDDNIKTEALTTTVTEGNKLSGDVVDGVRGVVYTTTAQKKSFAFDEWGYYDVMAFLGESYVSGYGVDSPLGHISQAASLLACEKLGRLLIDSKKPQIIDDDENLILQDGLNARLHVDESCSMALIELYRNDELLDRNYLQLPNTYIYKTRLEGVGEVAVLAIHIAEADCSKGNSCLVDGIFQLSEDLLDVGEDRPFGNMRITSVTADTIVMENVDYTVMLGKNMNTKLAGDYFIKTIGDDATSYYIYRQI